MLAADVQIWISSLANSYRLGPLNLHLAEIAAQIAPGAHAALLVDQPWRIMSIGLRNWAHGS